MMTGIVDGGGGAASSVRMISDNASDASDDDSLAFADLDTRKRKGLSFASSDAVESSDQNKRVRQESASEYSGFYSDPQQGATSAEEAPELDTSFDSRCDTSAFSSGEEGFSQRPDSFTQHKPGAFKQSQNNTRRADSWSGERNLLQLQLGSFIRKEKLRLESESQTSIPSLTSSGYDGVESSVPGDRDHSGNTFSGNSLSGYMQGSTFSAASSDNTGCYSSRTSSILSSVGRNKKKDHDAEERASLAHMVHLSRPSLSAAQQVFNSHASVHQKFVLSSGRPSNVTAAREDTRVYTIDRDFDDYFAKLML